MTDSFIYPFSAIIGHENAKKAFLCLLVNEDIRGLLVTGKRGTAKSVLLRSAEAVLKDKKIKIIPQNTTEDRLLGSIDIEKAVTLADMTMVKGILAESNSHMIVADDINLLDEKIVYSLLNTSETGSVLIERDGFSEEIKTRYILAATMDPEEGGISPQMLDRFDLCVDTDNIEDGAERLEIIRNCLEFEKEPEKFIQRFKEDTAEVRRNIENAKEGLPYVMIPEALMEIISELCLEMNVSGQRGDIALARTAKTIAAIDSRDNVIFEDIKEAALFTLQHRRRNSPPPSPESPDKENQDENENSEKEDEKNNQSDNNQNSSPKESPKSNGEKETADESKDDGEEQSSGENSPPPEQVYAIGSAFEVIEYLNEKFKKKSKKDKSGNRCSSVSCDNRGRYRSYKHLNKNKNDIAIYPSIKAAAPYQKFRNTEGIAISVKKGDLREKVRERKTGNIILFLVDASGSMGAGKRMVAVKGAIFSLLNDAYQKRDLVGLMTFRRNEANLLLPPTKSCDLAYKMLKEMPTGGRTPLSKGIMEAVKLMTHGQCSKKGDSKVIIILTDGRVNVSESGKNPYEELAETARLASKEDINFVVIDTEEGYPRIGFAKNLAFELEATYYYIDSLDKTKLANSVKEALYTQVQR